MMDILAALGAHAEFINAEIIPWVLRMVMLGLGMSLTLPDFKRVVLFPKAVTIGLLAQLFLLPASAFAIAWLFRAPPAIATGLVILAASPSGVTANAYSFAARADVPLCVTLSAITSVITVFTIPFLIGLALQVFFNETQEIAISASSMLLSLMTLTLLPLFVGMLFRFLFTEFAIKAEEPLRQVVLYFTIAVLLLGMLASYQEIIEYGASTGLLVIVMNVFTMASGYGLARLFRLPLAQVITITFEVGVQNLALAFAITFSILNRPDLAVAGLLYAVVMPATALAFVAIARRLNA